MKNISLLLKGEVTDVPPENLTPSQKVELLDKLVNRYGTLTAQKVAPQRRGKSPVSFASETGRSRANVTLEQIAFFTERLAPKKEVSESGEDRSSVDIPDRWLAVEDDSFEWDMLLEEAFSDLSNVPGNFKVSTQFLDKALQYANSSLSMASSIFGAVNAGREIFSARQVLRAGEGLIYYVETLNALEKDLENSLVYLDTILDFLKSKEGENCGDLLETAQDLKKKLEDILRELKSDASVSSRIAMRELGESLSGKAAQALASGITHLSSSVLGMGGSGLTFASIAKASSSLGALGNTISAVGGVIALPFAIIEVHDSLEDHTKRKGVHGKSMESLQKEFSTDKSESRFFRKLGKMIASLQDVKTAKAKVFLAFCLLGTAILGIAMCFVATVTWPLWVAIGVSLAVAAGAIGLKAAVWKVQKNRSALNDELRDVLRGDFSGKQGEAIRQQEKTRIQNTLQAGAAVWRLKTLLREARKVTTSENQKAQNKIRECFVGIADNFQLSEAEKKSLSEELEILMDGGAEEPEFLDRLAGVLEQRAWSLGNQKRGIEVLNYTEDLDLWLKEDAPGMTQKLVGLLCLKETDSEKVEKLLQLRPHVKTGFFPVVLGEFIEENLEARIRLEAADRLVKRDPEFGIFCLLESLQMDQDLLVQDRPAVQFLKSLGLEESFVEQCSKVASQSEALLLARSLMDRLNL